MVVLVLGVRLVVITLMTGLGLQLSLTLKLLLFTSTPELLLEVLLGLLLMLLNGEAFKNEGTEVDRVIGTKMQ